MNIEIDRYPILIVKDGDAFIAIPTDLMRCMAVGKTPEEALHDLKPAMLEWLDEAKERGIDIPAPGSVSLNAPISFLNGIVEEGFKFKESSLKLEDIFTELYRAIKELVYSQELIRLHFAVLIRKLKPLLKNNKDKTNLDYGDYLMYLQNHKNKKALCDLNSYLCKRLKGFKNVKEELDSLDPPTIVNRLDINRKRKESQKNPD
ncbi:type II toxin-antitoxin system HicB family antitoxin [Candidatus Liberibacter sp.]|uniref:type II toxin-antitoxin system HicB family antitoxin n=1 Tax=Candidatus Liberibacter sp. TaxID=34022 RepID=UPI0015F5D0BD|nr:type II toxin-antitoxin system HicB family antitoxin [Candidatus Liberibacter sp.]MBA5724591.1 type II toxin-antitoxin system HicB family antitoxin [Candidatus Liberibacter sp.]